MVDHHSSSPEPRAHAAFGLPGTDLARLKKDAKRWLRGVKAGDADALALLVAHHPLGRALADAGPSGTTLSDIHLAMARAYGLADWASLRRHVDLVTPWKRSPHRRSVPELPPEASRSDVAAAFSTLACLTYGADDLSRPARARAILRDRPDLVADDIYAAAAAGAAGSVRALLAADPALVQADGGPHRWPPLLYLAYSRVGDNLPDRSSLDTARVLLAAGADPDSGYLWEGLSPPFTALTGAFGGGEDYPNQPPHERGLELATLLLDAGADPNDGQVLYNRMFEESDDHLDLLFAHGLGSKHDGAWTRRLGAAHPLPDVMLQDQLLWASHDGRTRRVAILLDHGVDPNGRGSGHASHQGRTAYDLARRSGSVQIMDLLARAGAAVGDPLDPVDQLLADALAGHLDPATPEGDVVRGLIARHPTGVTRAVHLRRPAAVRLLVALGLDVDAGGSTALHQAAYSGDLVMVRLLVEMGADVTRRDDRFGATPGGWAEHAHRPDIADFLATLPGASAP